MPSERFPVRQVLESFRLAFDQGLTQREIAGALGISQSTVNNCIRRFRGVRLPGAQSPLDVDVPAAEGRAYARLSLAAKLGNTTRQA